MYEHQFKLSDSLQLDLDRDYSIRLEPKKYDYAISGRFKYEDWRVEGHTIQDGFRQKNILQE